MGESKNFVDYYALLQVPTDAEPSQIRLAYIRLAKMHHPDVGGSTDTMQQYNTAYRTLITSSSRKTYDLLHDFHTGTTAVKYHSTGSGAQGSSMNDLSDDEIDNFLDTILAELRAEPKSKKSLFAKIRELL